MDERFAVERVSADPVAARDVEFVERKGVGHPDSLCDGIAEAVSRRLSRYYRREFGRICHHNTDKVHLGAGRAEPAYGGGRLLEPIYVLVGGRATTTVDGDPVPVDDLAADAARDYLLDTVPALEADDVEVETRIGATSTDLASLFERGAEPLANDTSFGVGHAPGTQTERFVRTLEPRIHGELDAVGKDVKLMAVRHRGRVHLTVAAAVLDGHVSGRSEYDEAVARVRELAEGHARDVLDAPVSVRVNEADDGDAVYLTTTGLSAEAGDDGAVGRGNRANGLITPQRPMSLEATAGKNPVTHVGKLYNLVALRAARRLADGNAFACVQLVSRIGDPVSEPWAVDVVTTGERDAARAAVRAELDDVPALTDALVAGEVDTF